MEEAQGGTFWGHGNLLRHYFSGGDIPAYVYKLTEMYTSNG